MTGRTDLIRVGRKVIASRRPKGKFCHAVYGTIGTKRERHSHYLTEKAAKDFAKLFRTATAKKIGFRNIKVVDVCKRRRS